MSTAKVYRPVRDWKGQRPANLEDSYIGEVTGVVVGGAAPQPLARFPMVMTTEGQLGIPYVQDSGIIVDQFDLLVISGEKYLVQGERQWEEEHVFADCDVVDDYYWVEVKATA